MIYNQAEHFPIVSRLVEIFEDEELRDRIKRKLPYLFQLAEVEASRAGKVGMEVGSIRERILVALLIYKFGEDNVETEIPITEPEVDAKLFGQPISVKTITGSGGIKMVWTVDAQKAREFVRSYRPKCDIMLAHIRWNRMGGLYYIPLEVQEEVFRVMGRSGYFKLPKPGTNPRGVEISKRSLSALMSSNKTRSIPIYWSRSKVEYNPYKRWVEYWSKE